MTRYIHMSSGSLLKGDKPIGEDEFLYREIPNDNKPYGLRNGQVVCLEDDPEYIAEQERLEQERINNLTMTALDFVQVLISNGATYEQLKAYLDGNVALDMQLKYCQNVYCGVVRQLCPLSIGEVVLTENIAIEAFEKKNNPNYKSNNGE